MLTVKREKLYSGPFGPPRFLYVAYFRGENIAQGESKELAEKNAKDVLSNALACQGNMPIVSVAIDGTPISTREYSPGKVETVYHRRLEGGNSSCLGRMEIEGKCCSLIEYHRHFLEHYNSAHSLTGRDGKPVNRDA